MIEATLYVRPNGKKKIITVENIKPEDEKYLKDNNIELGMEDLDTPILGYAIYLSDGSSLEDGTPLEAIEISKSRTCEETISSAIKQFINMKEKYNERS